MNALILETKKLSVSKFSRADFEEFAALVANEEVMRFSIKGTYLNREEALEYFQNRILKHYFEYGFGMWALKSKLEGRLIGFAGLISHTIEGEKYIEVGYRLHPHYWGKGLAFEAVSAIIRFAFKSYGLSRLISIIDHRNIRSIRLAKRVGMQHLRNTSFHDYHVGIYGINKDQVAL